MSRGPADRGFFTTEYRCGGSWPMRGHGFRPTQAALRRRRGFAGPWAAIGPETRWLANDASTTLRQGSFAEAGRSNSQRGSQASGLLVCEWQHWLKMECDSAGAIADLCEIEAPGLAAES